MPQHDDSFNTTLAKALKSIMDSGHQPSRHLVLRIAEATQQNLEEAVAKRPADTLMIFLHPKPADIQLRRNFAAKGILVEEFRRSGFLRQRLFAAMEAIHTANVSLSSQEEIPPEIIEWIQTTVSDGFEKRNNLMRIAQTQMRCALANLPSITGPGREEMPSFDPAIPALLCGAGPSIRKQLPYIKSVEDKVLVICAGRAAKILAEAGIQPDYVVDIERNSQLYWDGNLHFNGTLVAYESTTPVVASSFYQFIWIDSGANPLRKTLSRVGIALPSIPASGPVASIMVGFALTCGARRLGLCGYDLSLAPDGGAYADGAGAMDKGTAKALEIPSVAGGTVETLPFFETTRRDLQATIDILKKAGLIFDLYNCSPTGAVIEGTMPMTLEGFCGSYAKTTKRQERSKTLSFAQIDTVMSLAIKEAETALAPLGKLVENLARINAELMKDAPRLELVQGLEKELPELFQNEVRKRTESELASSAFLQASLIAETWPVAKPGNELAARRGLCKNLLRQSLLHKDLLQDSLNDAKRILESKLPEHDVHVHPALRAHALRILQEGNPELAARLQHMPTGKPEDFELIPRFASPPLILSMRLPSGEKMKMAEFNTYKEDVQISTYKLVKDSKLDQQKDVAILTGHVNWGFASELAFRLPGLRMIIVYPWIDLLSHMTETCEFMGLLPQDALLVCPTALCPNWRKTMEDRIALWKGSCQRMLVFENDATKELPELQEARTAIKACLERKA